MYTTQLQAGQGLVDETRSLLAIWQPGMPTQALYRAALTSGRFSGITARRLRNVVAECFAPRYLADDGRPANSLKVLQSSISAAELKLLFLIHTCRANQILGDFLRLVYWPRYAGGYTEIAKHDAEYFVHDALRAGKMARPWSDSTVRRVSAYLLGCCGDFGLLSSASAGRRRMQQINITPVVTGYVAYDLHFRGIGDGTLAAQDDWSWLGLDPSEVLEHVRQLSVRGWLILQTAARVTQISWRFGSMEEYCDVVAR